MEKFGGVEESFWTQLFKIRYNQYRLSIYSWLPLHISENNNTLILANNQTFAAFVINILDENSVERLSNKVLWTFSKDHVESLVSIC
jgi:hypothetical protein